MRYILHNYRRCPFCIRVRIMMHLKAVSYEVVEEPLRKWTKWMQDWAQATGERPRIPVLEVCDDDGVVTVLTESNEINRFLDIHHGTREYTPEEGTKESEEVDMWLMWCKEHLKPTVDLYKYGEHLQFDREKHVVHTEALREHLEKIEVYLRAHAYLVDERLTIADVAIIPFIRQIMRTRDGEFDFTDFPRVEAWTRAIIDTKWFEDEVMKKHLLAPVGE